MDSAIYLSRGDPCGSHDFSPKIGTNIMTEAGTRTARDAPLSYKVLENLPDASVTVFDQELRCRFAAGQGLHKVGLSSEMLVGKRLDELLSPEELRLFGDRLEHAFGGEELIFDLPFRGEVFEILTAPIEHDEAGVSSILVVGRIVTSERRREAGLRFLDRAGELLGTSLDFDSTLEVLADLAVEPLADWYELHLADEEGELQRIMIRPADPSYMAVARVFEAFEFRREAPIGPAHVFRSGETEFYPEVRDESLAAMAYDPGHFALMRSFDLVSLVIVPLRVQDRVIGTITLGVVQPHSPYTEEDRELVERLAQRAAQAIENARLFRSVREELDRRERAEAGERLRVSALNRLAASDVIGIVTTEGNQIVEANDVFLRLVGRDAVDLTAGRLNWWDLTPVEFHHLGMNSIAELLATGASTPFEQEFLRRDETRVPVLIGAALLDREPFRWVSFVVDLSARQAMEEAHRAFIEDVGHDLRNPMAVTRWAAQLMRRHLWAGQMDLENLDHGLATIENSTTRMELLLDDLMDAARLRLGQSIALNLEETDLVELAESSVDSHRQSTDLHTIAFQTSDRAITGIWDRVQVGRVLDNLLSNAIKYSLKGGRVDVNLERKRDSSGELAVISVRDEGIGIPEAELSTVFDRLRRGTEAAAEVPGLGIGLAGVKQIVEQHGGTISAESREGQGSKFTVELPILTAPPS